MNFSAVDLKKIIDDNMEDLNLPREVARCFEKFDGKKISKRMFNAIQKELDCYNWNFYNSAGMVQISTRANDREYNFLLGYIQLNGKMPVFSLNKFTDDYNPAYFRAAEKRNEQRKEISIGLLEELADKINEFNFVQRELNSLMGHLPFDIKMQFDKLKEDD